MMWYKSLVYLGLGALALSTGGPAVFAAGWENGNAGDTYAYEFILSAKLLAQKLELLRKSGAAPVFDTANLRATIANTEVASEEHVFLRGLERDAVNYFPAQRLIKVGRAHWRDLRRSTRTVERLRVVLHEYLWVMGTDDSQYRESMRVIGLLNIGNFSPSTWWNPVNPMNYVVPSLVVAPPGCSLAPVTLNPKSGDEVLEVETVGSCGEAFRHLKIVKSTGTTPASSNVHGLFHSFEISVTDGSHQRVGELLYEPGWGECLIPDKENCRGSGKITVGGLELVFWFLID